MESHTIRVCVVLLFFSSFGRVLAEDEPKEYRVVPGESEVDILVFRAGALARLGHNHVITARNLNGRVSVGDTAAASSFELSLAVAGLTVDDPAARQEAGSAFTGEVAEGDRAGTRRNMLGTKLLDAGRYPEVRVRSTGITGDFGDMTVTAEIDIRDGRHVVELPVSAVLYGDRLVATGRATLVHSALELSPFTAGLGTLKTGDDLTFRYRIVAIAEDSALGSERTPAIVEDDGVALPDRTAE